MVSSFLLKLRKNKRTIIFILLFVLGFFVSGDMAFADSDELAQKIGKLLNEICGGLAIFLGLITYLVALFLSPEWINGSVFEMTAYFKAIWIMISNIVYFIFAFILIYVAFMNIIGRQEEQYQLKKALPRFLIGVLIVPLSWFIVQFILSISSILTIVMLNLPFDTFENFENEVSKVEVPTNCSINLSSKNEGGEGTAKPEIFDCDESSKVPLGKILSSNESSESIFGVISLYTYGIVGVEGLDKLVDKWDLDSVKRMIDLIIKLVFDVLFVLVYVILIIALGFVLVTRGIYIWLYVMFSPLAGLLFFLKKGKEGIAKEGGFFQKMNVKDFIGVAFVPVFAMAALSFGFLFLYLVSSGINDKTCGDKGTSSSSEKQGVITISGSCEDGESNVETIKIGQFTLKVEGNVGSKVISFGKDALGTIGGLVVKILGIMVLWGAMMAAFKTSDIAKGVIEPLEKFGNSVGNLILKSPQYLPIFPTGAGQLQSMASLGHFGSSLPSQFEKGSREAADRLGESFGLPSQRTQRVDTINSFMNTKDFRDNINEGGWKNKDDRKELVEKLKDLDNTFFNDLNENSPENIKAAIDRWNNGGDKPNIKYKT